MSAEQIPHITWAHPHATARACLLMWECVLCKQSRIDQGAQHL